MELAPIVLFVYNRPWHTQQTLEALSRNKLADQSILYVFADGPKQDASDEDLRKILQTRAIVKSCKWCKEVKVIEKEGNAGLTTSIIEGVTQIINKYGKIIVLEDDIVPSIGFLIYMNQALSLYFDNPYVMHISAYMYPVELGVKTKTTFFCNILSCWGWGTWQRAWQYYNHNIDEHLSALNSTYKKKQFDIKGGADFYQQLRLNKEGKIYSWAVRWYSSWLNKGGFSLFPIKSLVKNIGHDGTGVHCQPNTFYDTETIDYIFIERLPLTEDGYFRKKINNYYLYIKYGKNWRINLLKNNIKSLLRNSLKKIGVWDIVKSFLKSS